MMSVVTICYRDKLRKSEKGQQADALTRSPKLHSNSQFLVST